MEIIGIRILPVFAGMIPAQGVMSWDTCYSPRIRGDDPHLMVWHLNREIFSPYSRG